MSEGINTDKVIVNAGGGSDGSGGMGGAGLAAVIAALGNRNESSDHGMGGIWPALLAGGGGFGGGNLNAILPVLLLLGLLGGGRRGPFGGGDGGDCCGEGILLSKLGSIEGSIPLVGANIQNALLEQTGVLGNQINQVGLAQLQASSAVKDSVQNGTAAVLQNNSTNTQSILGAICNLSSKIDTNTITDLQRQLSVAQLDGLEHRVRTHADGVEVRVSQNVNQQQGQLQAQLQSQRLEDERFARLFGLFNNINNQVQRVKSDQDTINFGTMLASGNQATTSTQVR